MSERRLNTTRLSYACDIAAGILALSILMAAAGAHSLFTAAGAFLFERFHLASLYFPALILLSGLLIRSGRFPRRTMILTWISPIPFLTLAVFLQVSAGNTTVLASRMLIDGLGRIPSAILFLMAFSLEILAMVKLTSGFRKPEDILLPVADLKERIRAILGFLGLQETPVEETAAGGEEPTLEDRPPMAFPDFPDAPEPIAEAAEPFLPAAPNKPFPPESPVTDPVVSDLIYRALKPVSTPGPAAAQLSEDVPRYSAFPAPPDVTPAPADIRDYFDKPADESIAEVLTGSVVPAPVPIDPAFAFLAGDDELDDMADAALSDEGIIGRTGNETAKDRSDEIPVELFPSGVYESQEDESEPVSRLSELTGKLPEEEPGNNDISDKLDPQGSSPVGIIVDKKGKVKPRSRKRKKYTVPVAGLLAQYPDDDFSAIDESTRRAGEVLEQTLKEFKIDAKVTGIRKGPVITMYELLPAPGVKINRIVTLQDNIALRLAASRIRIVAPIPGKHAIGIEVPNKKRAIVSFSSLVESEEFEDIDSGIPVILGKDISGGNQVIDLTKTPHLLIAGATGSGKSVCVNSLIGSILYSRTPQEVKMIMVDPKIVELKLYNDIPHLLTPVITEPKKALQALQWCLFEMERRYSLLDTQGVRDIKTYNKRVKDRKLATEPLPYIVVLVDEFADLMATSGKELEAIVARLAAMSRAVGIHLVLATQRPSVDVITGLIKANFPSRIAFMVAGKTDSRIIIDEVGAEKLLGRGDMLFTSAWDPFPSRVQGAFLAEEEVERMADHVKTLGEPDYIDEDMFFDDEEEEEFRLEAASGDDPMFDKALEIVVSSRKASASYLQRRLKIGYNRAARLVEDMEARGIVGPPNGSKPRDLLHIPERFAVGQNVDIG